MATRRHTVHVSAHAVNLYGGKPDNRRHLEGQVRNVDEVVSRGCFFYVFCILIRLVFFF